MADSDSDISWSSGDSRKYCWIHGDNNYEMSSESEGSQSGPEEAAPTEELLEMMDDTATEAHPRVLELEALTRDLTDRLYESEDKAERRSVELSTLRAVNEHLVQRVSSLTVQLCSVWVDQYASRARANRLSICLFIVVAVIIVLAGKLVPARP